MVGCHANLLGTESPVCCPASSALIRNHYAPVVSVHEIARSCKIANLVEFNDDMSQMAILNPSAVTVLDQCPSSTSLGS